MATQHFLNWIEGKAQGLRSACGVSTFGRLDPFELANVLDVELFAPADIGPFDPDILNQLTVSDSSAWSAGMLYGPDGRKLLVVNPTHNSRRQRASLMEELAHLSLNHKPSRLMSYDGVIVRTWNKTQETEAYWVGAAALMHCDIAPQWTLRWIPRRRQHIHRAWPCVALGPRPWRLPP